jgi:hypothetical protein
VAFNIATIVSAVNNVFTADPVMILEVPGGLYHQRAPSREQTAVHPYAVLGVVAGEKEDFSDYSCLQQFPITIRIYGGQQAADTGEIAGALSSWNFSRTLLEQTGLIEAKVMGLFPTPEALELDPELKEGQDVTIAERGWMLLLHIQQK